MSAKVKAGGAVPPKNSGGRPVELEGSKAKNVRFAGEELALVDAWMQRRGVKFSAAVREMVRAAGEAVAS